MVMDYKTKQKAAREFAQEWVGRGYEKGDAQVFWTELLRDVVGMKRVSSEVKFEYRTADGGFIDVLIPDAGVLIEQKGLNIDLDKPEERQGRMVTPFEQALAYAESFPRDVQPRFIVTCNFGTFRVYDRDAYSKADLPSRPLEFILEELPDHLEYLDFLTDPANSRLEKEKAISIEAGRLVGKLYDALRERYINPESSESQHSLNVLCVRLVFCMFCEDARGLFPPNAFLNYLQDVPPENVRPALQRLFAALDTPLDERDPYDERIKPFPYVNGGLFQEKCEIPNFTLELKQLLLDECAGQTDWSKISPTIFGSIFESTLNPQTRHDGGMHYTSPENIHKVIDPLFLNALYQEFNEIKGAEGVTEKKRQKALEEFRNKIGSMRFLDPACGSGNFLTESFLSLRKLEDDVLNELHRGQVEIIFETPDNDRRVSLDQFYGIEINDFACRVAKTALWIAQLQANNESESMLDISIDDFPLKDSANIVCANALKLPWGGVLPPDQCDYIMGNPPFLGHQWRSKEQQSDMDIAFASYDRYGKLDYVAAWYAKAADYIGNLPIHCAFVSTNSIAQGESVSILMRQLFERGFAINFAYPTFVWENESNDQAHVHVVIIGFSPTAHQTIDKTIFYADNAKKVNHINGYLVDADDVFIANRSKPINPEAPKMTKGSQPTDGGNLILSPEEKEELISSHPSLADVIKRYMGGREFINEGYRYCLWFVGKNLANYNYPEIRERLEAVAEARKSSPTSSVREAAETPALFTQIRQPRSDYIALPVVSSERRQYIPVGMVSKEIIASDQLRFIPTDDKYILGLLMSKAHMAWMRVVSGRLKSDYRYAPAVYNSFVFPKVNENVKAKIANLAQIVLDARALYPDASLANLYDPDNRFIYPELMKAHRELDAAVEVAYGVDFGGDEEKMVAHLFKLYAETANQ